VTDARLVSKPPQASGLTGNLCSALYAQRLAGRTPETLTVIGVLRVVGDKRRSTAKGEVSVVELEFDQLEVLDRAEGDDVDRARMMIDEARGRRHTPSAQMSLIPDDRDELLKALQQWADDTGRDLDAEWAVHFGEDYVAPVDKGSLIKLKEFAYKHQVIEDSPVADEDDSVAPDPERVTA
jgi:hypothetical protein